MTFQETEIDTREVNQSLLDVEDRQRTSLFSWNGQFSPQFIEAMLKSYGQHGDTVFDPFAGSGTVVDEAIRIGMGSIATELNPAAYHMAKIRQAARIEKSVRADVCDFITRRIDTLPEGDDCFAALRCIFDSAEGFSSDILALLVVLCDFYKNESSKQLVENKWHQLSKAIMSFPQTDFPVQVEWSDARSVPFVHGAADMVITSPPYINVMNYHQQYRRSVEALGYPVLKIAKSEFGANRLNRGNRFLTVIEYAVDMGLSMREASRVLKCGHRMIYVVGRESRVLGHPFCNSEIVWRVADEVLGLKPMLRQQRRFKNRYGKFITEDILHFGNTDCQGKSDDEITRSCQAIAKDALVQARDSCETTPERRALLDEAILRHSEVGRCQ